MLNELKTFIAVVHHGTFAAAGEHIGLTQSAVSSQIKRLESTLGLTLFDRTRRTATLNAAGAATLSRAEEIVALCAALGDPPGTEDLDGLLRIGAIASVQSSLLPRALGLLRRRHPRLRVHLVPGVSMHLLDQLDAGELDVALMIRPPFGVPPELKWQALVHEPFQLLVPKALVNPDWRELLSSHPFLRYERKSFGGRIVERFLREHQLVVQDAIELDEIEGLIQLVANGLGVALVPMSEAHWPLPESVRAMTLGAHTFYREIGLLQRTVPASPVIMGQLEHSLRDAAGPGWTATPAMPDA